MSPYDLRHDRLRIDDEIIEKKMEDLERSVELRLSRNAEGMVARVSRSE